MDSRRETSPVGYDADQLVTEIFNGAPWIDFIIRYSKVNDALWQSVGEERLRTIKYLMCHKLDLASKKKKMPAIEDLKYAYYTDNTRSYEIVDYISHVPNLVLFDFGNVKDWSLQLSEVLSAHPKLCALLFNNGQWLNSIDSNNSYKTLENIRFLSSVISDGSKLFPHVRKLEQLYIPNGQSVKRDFLDSSLLRSPRLKRLHLSLTFTDISKNNPNPRKNLNMEMLEISFANPDHQFVDMECFLSRFHRLKFLYVFIGANKIDGKATKEASNLHKSLESVVFAFGSTVVIRDWYGFEVFIKKCKNLRTLAVRNCCLLTPIDVVTIIEALPKLSIFDCRGCSQIQRPLEMMLRNHAVMKNRKIKFVQNDTQCNVRPACVIREGFDFMKNVFYQDFHKIPQILFRSR